MICSNAFRSLLLVIMLLEISRLAKMCSQLILTYATLRNLFTEVIATLFRNQKQREIHDMFLSQNHALV